MAEPSTRLRPQIEAASRSPGSRRRMVDFRHFRYYIVRGSQASRGQALGRVPIADELKEKRRWRVSPALTFPIRNAFRSRLTYIHGIGRTSAEQICEKLGIPPERRAHELTDDEVLRIRELIDRDYTVEGDLRRIVAMNIKRLMDLGCYRGLRHRKGLPVRGQAYPYQCAHPQGAGAADRGQEDSAVQLRRSSKERRSWRRTSQTSANTAAAAPRLRRARAQEHHRPGWRMSTPLSTTP